MKSSSGYEIYHNTLSSVLDEVERYVQTKGYEVGDYFPEINHVSYGTTERTQLEMLKDGRIANTLAIQIYRLDSGKYELNCYPVRKFALGGGVESNTENLILEIKKNSFVSKGIESTAKDGSGQKYRYDHYKYKANSAPNWIVLLFDKCAKENGKPFATQFNYKGIYSIHYERNPLKNQPNGKIGMSELVLINSDDKFATGGKVLWGTKVGEPDYNEQLITENENQIEAAKKWAEQNGFDRLRIQNLDLTTPPDFKKTFGKGGGIDYRGEHKAPSREDEDAPLHKLELIYPEDIYSSNAVRYYGANGGDAMDRESISIMQSARNKPNKPIKIYRAVPDSNFDVSKQLKELNSIIFYNDKWKFFPSNNQLIYSLQDKYSIDDYSYDKQKELILEDINNQINSLELKLQKTIGINNNDWVTINRAYAKEHGESNLNNQYKIVSKQVKASELFTDGNSIHEFGYSEENPKMAKGGGIKSIKVGDKFHYKFDGKDYEVLGIENSKIVLSPIPLGSYWNNKEISFSLMNKWIIEKTMRKI